MLATPLDQRGTQPNCHSRKVVVKAKCGRRSEDRFSRICLDLEGFIRLGAAVGVAMGLPKKAPPIGEHVMVTQATVKTAVDTKVKDVLDHIRASAQALHGAMSDAAAKPAGATKADLEAFAQKAKAVTESAKAAVSSQNDAAKKHLTEAVGKLEATQKHVAESLKSSGQAFQTSVRKAVSDARASVQKISEAVAAKRSAASTKKPK